MSRTKAAMLSVIAFFCIVLIGLSVYINSKQLKVEFYENPEVNVNETVDNYQFIKRIENGTIITEKTLIDTASVGEKNISLTVKPVFGSEKVFSYSILVVDRESPEITFTDHLEVSLGNEIDLLQGVSAADNSGEAITVTVEGSYDINTAGEYKLKYVACDSSLNKSEGEFVLSVVDREGPKITYADHLETDVGCEIDLLKDVSADDNSGEAITVTVEGSYDINTVGEYKLKYVAVDSGSNKTEVEFILSVVDRESPKIIYTDHLETDVGKKIDLLKGVSATDNSGEEITVTVDGSYDIKKVGEYKLKYVALDSSLNKAEEEFVLSVVDHESPKIKFTDHLETVVGQKIDLLKGVSATDNSGEKITVTVEGKYDINTAGEYKLKYVAYDSSLNKAEEKFILKVKDAVSVPTPPPQNNGDPNDTDKSKPEIPATTTSKGFTIVVKDGVTYVDGYLIANKTYSLPKSYGNGLTSETKSAFNKMSAAAKKDGFNIYIVSGFRSYSTQKNLYNNYVKRDGAEKADTYSARAGHSEHQSGLAFDVNSVKNSFANTPEAAWLSDNCYKYGFILRYPKGKTNETGYIFEPWHFRYVGVELATKLYNGGDWITMEDYFGITSEYSE